MSGAVNGIGTRYASKYICEETGKEVIFIPYASKAFPWQNKQIDKYLTKMKQKEYTVFRDGVLPSYVTTDTINMVPTSKAFLEYGFTASFYRDSIAQRETMLKQRKITGAITEWDDPSSRKCQFYQSNIEGRDDEYWIDLTLGDLIQQYEKDFGEVRLSEYDYKTKMMDSYTQQQNDTNVYHVYEFVSMYRMDNIVNKIMNSEQKKIVLVFDKYYLDRIAYKFQSPSYYGYSKVARFKIRNKDLRNSIDQ